VRRFAVRHRADDGELVRHLRRLLEHFAEDFPRQLRLHRAQGAAVLDGGQGFRIERLLCRHAARQEDVNDRLGRPFLAGVILDFGPGGLGAEAEVIAEGHPHAADQADVEEVPPRRPDVPRVAAK
jgi:hypothetical protein